jgi:hypothetical protein
MPQIIGKPKEKQDDQDEGEKRMFVHVLIFLYLQNYYFKQ